MAIADKGVFYTDDYIKESCKESGCDNAFYNGHFYSGYAPGPTFLALPLYAISKPFIDYFTPSSFFGYDNLKEWHYHPYKNPSEHISCDKPSTDKILYEIKKVFEAAK